MSLFVGLLAFPGLDFGIWPRVELPTLALWAGAGLCGAGLALEARSMPPQLLCSPLTASLAGLFGLTIVLAPFSRYPWLSLTGAPQGGEGGLRYLAFLLLVASMLRLYRHQRLRNWLIVAAAAAALIAASQAYVSFGGGTPFVFREYLAYPAIAVGALALSQTSTSGKRLGPLAIAIAAAVVLAASTNRSAWVAVLVAGALAAAITIPSLNRFAASLNGRRTVAAVLALLPWAILAIIVSVGLEAPIPSIRARALVYAALFDAVAEDPWIGLMGAGWGRTTELFAAHLTAAPASLWDGSWDNADRDLFHSHHAGFEAFLAVGLGGAILWTLASVAPVLMAPATRLPAAVFLSGALVFVDAMWFQFPFATGCIALAIAAVLDPGPAETRHSAPFRAGALAGAAIMAVACAFVGLHGLEVARARQAFTTSADECAEFPPEAWRGNIGLSYLFDETLQGHRAALAGLQPAAGTIELITRLFCVVDHRAATQRTPYLMMVGLLFRNELAFAPGAPLPLREELASTWEARVEQFLPLAPRRTDLAAPLLAAWAQRREFGRIERFARKLLYRRPQDPVGLYFLGIARLASAESARQRQEGIQLLRESAAYGIERIMPIHSDIRNIIARH